MPVTFSSVLMATFIMTKLCMLFLIACIVFNSSHVVSAPSHDIRDIRPVSHPTLSHALRCRIEMENCISEAFGNRKERIKECIKCQHHCSHGMQFESDPQVQQEMTESASDCADTESDLRMALLTAVKNDCYTIGQQVFLGLSRDLSSAALVNCITCIVDTREQKNQVEADEARDWAVVLLTIHVYHHYCYSNFSRMCTWLNVMGDEGYYQEVYNQYCVPTFQNYPPEQ